MFRVKVGLNWAGFGYINIGYKIYGELVRLKKRYMFVF